MTQGRTTQPPMTSPLHFARSADFGTFRLTQIVAMLVLPVQGYNSPASSPLSP